MKNALLAAVLSLAVAPAVAAQESNPGRDLAIAAFETLDTNQRGFVDIGQFDVHGRDIFASMDANENGRIDLDEFLQWDFGMRAVAEERDAVTAYEAALRVVHAFWDRDGDGEIDQDEHRYAVGVDFQRADIDSDDLLTKEEFLNGFTVMVAIRAALAPDIR